LAGLGFSCVVAAKQSGAPKRKRRATRDRILAGGSDA
jgi:hypothetical protein